MQASELELIQWEIRPAGEGCYRLGRLTEVDSTNSLALRHLASLQHGDVLCADRQWGGRGRSNRVWQSPPGNLCLSMVLKPETTGSQAATLATTSFLLCHAVCCVLDQFQVRGQIKWPNDIRVQGRKIAGILAESVFQGQATLGLVLGLGVNLQMTEDEVAQIDQPATALNLLTGHPISTRDFLDRFLSEFQLRLGPYLRTGFPALRSHYLERCEFIGKTVRIATGGQTVTGLALTVNPDGALEVLTEDGAKRIIHAGEMANIFGSFPRHATIRPI